MGIYYKDLKGLEDPAAEPLYGWCLHCERAFHIKTPFLETCPLDGCDGDHVWDLSLWDDEYVLVFREMNDYPAIPEHGGSYPIYGRKA